MTAAAKDLYIKGVRVETHGDPSRSAPLLFVHGGGQGSWAWEKIAPRLAQHGWYAVCLNLLTTTVQHRLTRAEH